MSAPLDSTRHIIYPIDTPYLERHLLELFNHREIAPVVKECRQTDDPVFGFVHAVPSVCLMLIHFFATKIHIIFYSRTYCRKNIHKKPPQPLILTMLYSHSPLILLSSSSSLSQASLKLTSGLPPIQGANLSEICPLVVRYLFDVLSNKYRTSTEELPNIFLCSSQGGSALHRS